MRTTIIVCICFFTQNSYAEKLYDASWLDVNHCKITYLLPSIQTITGKRLSGMAGWEVKDFPKTVINGECHIQSRQDYLIIYEGNKEWSGVGYFFYVNYLESTDTYSIHGQPNPEYTHAQWNITEDAILDVIDSTTGCFISHEIKICFN